MIDLISVFSTGGIVLWQKIYQGSVPENVVNSLVREVFIENRAKKDRDIFHKDNYTVKYLVSNDYGLVFVVAYQSIIHLSYSDEFLSNFNTIFLALLGEQIKINIQQGAPIDEGLDFLRLTTMIDVRLEEFEKSASSKGVYDEQQRSKTLEKDEATEEVGSATAVEAQETKPDAHRRVRRSGRNKGKNSPVDSGAEDSKKKSKKKMRRWGDDGAAEDDDGDAVLDYSGAKGDDDSSYAAADDMVGDIDRWGQSNKKGEFLLNDLSTEMKDILNNSSTGNKGKGSSGSENSAFGFLRNFVGGKTLSQEDLQKALAAMREHLLKKNVANEVADHLCSTVDKSLVGSKTQSWTTVEATVKSSMTEALRRILTPNTSLDLLHEVEASHKRGGRPYVISVVGVNGVGKSTNLSKLAFWLLQNKYKVLIAACDTFRSGAVEQLKVHVRRLQELTTRLGSGQVEIFDQGYGKDAAVIAQKAIDHGQRGGFDVVLIDTAGRRHNDERLMSSLEKFGKLAQPNKIIMVGEALVGTDSVKQAQNFNAAFGPTRNLDFFLISKCDTVGDMIGSMVNMTYSTGIPVLFVGIGQNYTDLRNLSVSWAVNLLMS